MTNNWQLSHGRIVQLTALIMTHGLAITAHAQNTDATNASSNLPEVVVRGEKESYKTDGVSLPKLTEPLRDTAKSITVVPRELMDDQNSTTLRDALRNVAGISIAAGEGGSQGDNLTLRGFSARGDIFLDGMRDFGSYYRDPFNLGEVDVLKGPESVMFGRGSTGGVINQGSKLPTLQQEVAGMLSVGTDLTRRGTADINEPVPQLGNGTAVRLNLMGNDSQVADRDVAENRRVGFAPSITIGLGTPTEVTASYLHQSEDDIPDYGLPWIFNKPAPVSRNNFYGFDTDYLRTTADVATLRVEHTPNDQFSLRDQVRYANYSRDFRITEPKLAAGTTPATPISAINIIRNELTGSSVETFLQNQFDVTSKFNTGFMHHTVVAGIEATRETSDPKRFAYTGVPTTGLVDPNEDQTFAGVATKTSDVHTTATGLGLYALDSLKLGEHWEVSGGFRWDYFDADFANAVNKQSFTRVDRMPSWRGALVYKPVENGSIYFDYGTSFNPSAEQVSLSLANANTAPEKNQTFELGTKWDLLKGRLVVRGAIFETEKENAREPDPNNPTLNVLGGDQRVRGVEWEAAGKITDDWKIFSGYALMESRVVSSKFYPGSVGYPLANVPKHTFNLWTTYQLPWRFEIGGGVNYVASRTASSTVPLDPTTHELKMAPDYWTLNAMLRYKLNDHVDFQVNIYNLTDNYYYDQIHPAHIIPGAGLSALFSTSFRF